MSTFDLTDDDLFDLELLAVRAGKPPLRGGNPPRICNGEDREYLVGLLIAAERNPLPPPEPDVPKSEHEAYDTRQKILAFIRRRVAERGVRP